MADRERDERLTLLWGGLLILVGLWFFLDQTLNLSLPDIPWGDLWPVLLIAVGLWIVFAGLRRRRA